MNPRTMRRIQALEKKLNAIRPGEEIARYIGGPRDGGRAAIRHDTERILSVGDHGRFEYVVVRRHDGAVLIPAP